MKKLILVAALLAAFAAKAQTGTYGFTGSFGAFKTLVSSSERAEDDFGYAPGLQLQLGAWLRLPLSEKGSIQLTALHTIERQGGEKLTVIDQNNSPAVDVRTRYGSLAVGATALYLRHLSEKLSVGAGAGATYKYAAVMAIQGIEGAGVAELDKQYDDRYHRKLKLYLPLEAQLAISPRISLLAQAQVPLSRRVAASESAFRERDFGVTLGVNYTLQ